MHCLFLAEFLNFETLFDQKSQKIFTYQKEFSMFAEIPNTNDTMSCLQQSDSQSGINDQLTKNFMLQFIDPF